MSPDVASHITVRRLLLIALLCASVLPYTAAAAAAPANTTSVTIRGEITDTGGSPPTVRGVVYGLTPAYGATTSESGSFSTGSFVVTISGLFCNTTYHYANYATNDKGTGYGEDRTFVTGACPGAPADTSAPPAPSNSSAQHNSGGGPPNDGGVNGAATGPDAPSASNPLVSVLRALHLSFPAIERMSPLVLTTAEITGVAVLGYAALYATSINRFITEALLSLLAWLAYFGAAKALRKKKIGVVGTHNAYVIVGEALDEGVVERVYRLKGPSPQTPYPVLISAWEDLKVFDITLNQKQVEALQKKYWPGPVNVVLPCNHPKFAYLHRGTGTLVFRFPADFLTLSLLRRSGPLLAPTANPEGRPIATTIEEAKNYFKGEIDFFINKGTLPGLAPMLIQLGSEGEVTVLDKGKEELS